jgi:hypothetical protein
MTLDQLASWGQHMHWAHLNFERFSRKDDTLAESEQIGLAAHWLASEYVVLEGWQALGLKSKQISRVLDAYPEHLDLLRRCRNAVYHFQERPLDPRFSMFMKDENEELRWTAALHFEFQGYLIRYATVVSARSEDPSEIQAGLAKLLGWFPNHPYSEQLGSVHALVAEATVATAGDESHAAKEVRQAARDALAVVRLLDMFPLTSSLRRLQTHAPSPQGGA